MARFASLPACVLMPCLVPIRYSTFVGVSLLIAVASSAQFFALALLSDSLQVSMLLCTVVCLYQLLCSGFILNDGGETAEGIGGLSDPEADLRGNGVMQIMHARRPCSGGALVCRNWPCRTE